MNVEASDEPETELVVPAPIVEAGPHLGTFAVEGIERPRISDRIAAYCGPVSVSVRTGGHRDG